MHHHPFHAVSKILVRDADYIVRDHRVHGRHIMPGVTFLDLIYRLFRQKNIPCGCIELSNILFSNVVSTSEKLDRRLWLAIESRQDQAGQVIGSSERIPADSGKSGEKEVHVSCEYRWVAEPPPRKQICLPSLIQSAGRIQDMDEVYALARKGDIQHGPFMKGLGRICQGPDFLLAEIRLSELASSYLDHFLLHPALLDCATAIPFLVHFARVENPRPMIPIHIESFQAFERLQPPCFALVQCDRTQAPSLDLMYADIDIFNAEGALAAAFRKISFKTIRLQNQLDSALSDPAVREGSHQLREPPATPERSPALDEPAGLERAKDTACPTPTIGEGAPSREARAVAVRTLQEMIARRVGRPMEEIELKTSFYDLGLDSRDLLSLVSELERRHACSFYPTLLFEYNHIEALAEFLVQELGSAAGAPQVSDPVPANLKAAQDECLWLAPQWMEAPLEAGSQSPAEVGGLLLLYPASGEQMEVDISFKEGTGLSRAHITRVFRGDRYRYLGGQSYTIEVGDPASHQRLVQALARQDRLPHVCVILHPVQTFEPCAQPVRQQLQESILPMMRFVRALMAANPPRPIRVVNCFRAASAGIHPLQEAVAAWGRTVSVESGGVELHTVTLDPLVPVAAIPSLLESEIRSLSRASAQVAYRQGKRWVRVLKPASAATPARALPIKPGATYLITGGLGGIGLVLAGYLLKQFQATCLLTGRSALSPPQQEKLSRLERAGGRVLYYPCDVSRTESCQAFYNWTRQQRLAIQGVFHCAGVVRDSLWTRKTEAELLEVLAPKVLGTLVLEEVLAAEPLDFLLLFSSTAAVKGNPGQSDYAFANAFMDHYAEWREQAPSRGSRRTLAVNWPLWQEGGMRLDAQAQARLAEVAGMKPLDSALGNTLWQEALQREEPVLMPLYGHVEKLKRFFGLPPAAPAPETPPSLAPAQTIPLPPPVVGPAAGGREEPFAQEDLTQLIAVVGLSGRYPQADDLDQFWDNLAAGKNCVTQVPPERWAPAGDGLTPVPRWGGFLANIDQFDALLFHISPKDAARIDPEERLMLQTVWETLEDAGYTRETLQRQQAASGKGVGVFVGCMYRQYPLLAQDPEARGILSTFSNAGLANRISYFFDFKGPSLCLDTACSSSLTAIHLACESLRRGECLAAFAGGVNLSLLPHKYTALDQAGILGSGPLSRSLGDGDGFVPGEGVGGVLLKPLAAALQARDQIYGIIRGSHVNHGGATAGFSVPSAAAEAELIQAALVRSRTPPGSISYLEVAANGSPLGDAIELAALRKVFPPLPPGGQPYCALGSVKSNIGHLEAASGISQLTKVLLQLRRRQLAPSLHAEPLNPKIQLQGSPFYLQNTLSEWPAPPSPEAPAPWPRRAAISSFGAGGSNAHLILEEFRPEAPPGPAPGPSPALVLLSARDADRLNACVQKLTRYLQRALSPAATAGRPRLCDIAHTSQVGREPMRERLAIVASSLEELLGKCERFLQAPAALPAGMYRGSVKANVESSGEGSPGRNVESWLAGEQLPELAEVWIQGGLVDWTQLPSSRSSRRVTIPFYPFEPRRHWLSDVQPPLAARPLAAQLPGTPPPGRVPPAEPAADPQWAESLRTTVVRMIAKLLHAHEKDIYTDEDLSVYGFDSVSITELAAQIRETYHLDLQPPQFFEFTSIEGLVQYLIRRVPAPSPQCPPGASNPASATASESPASRESVTGREERAGEGGSVGSERAEPIAIVGMAGILPQSADLDQFWEHLRQGRNLVSEIPLTRWDWRTYWGNPAQEPGKSNSKWGGFMPGVEQFDALFFGISAREARLMDPQQRLFLQTTWKCLEDAGHRPSELRGTRTGVFVGVSSFDYRERVKASGEAAEPYSATGLAACMMANRISYLFDWHGPSEAVDTACSSALVALHRAVQAIHHGECAQAIAGGANVLLNPEIYVAFSQAGMLSPEGRCKAFDHRADGYVRGEGVGAVFLKPLRQAQQDGDSIYGVILATSVNHGGRVNSLTTPNPNVQAALLVEAYQQAGIPVESVGYIEAHGTGTALGDPVEINGLKKAFTQLYERQGRPFSGPPHCGVGTVKTNLGHLESAAGMAGLLKVLLALRHQQLPATLHFERLNPYIDLQSSPFYIVDRLIPWPRLRDAAHREMPRRAGISSFGFGGTNAHVVLEESPPATAPSRAADPGECLVLLSAKNPDRLLACAREMVRFLETLPTDSESHPSPPALLDLAYTTQVGREPMDERLAILTPSLPDLLARLQAFVQRGEPGPHMFRGSARQAPEAARALVEGREGQAYVKVLFEDHKLHKLAALWASGANVDWRLLYPGATPRRVSLPTYPFEPERHWIDEPQPASQEPPADSGRTADWNSAEALNRWGIPPVHGPNACARQMEASQDQPPLPPPIPGSGDPRIREDSLFRKILRRDHSVLTDHMVHGQAVLPGVVHFELALQALRQADPRQPIVLRDVVFESPLIVEAPEIEVLVRLESRAAGFEFQILTQPDPSQPARVHSRGRAVFESPGEPPQPSLPAIRQCCAAHLEPGRLYQSLEARGLQYGPSFQSIRELHAGKEDVIGVLERPRAGCDDWDAWLLPPWLLDGALQCVAGFARETNSAMMPFAVESLRMFRRLPERVFAHVRVAGENSFDITLLDEANRVCVQLERFVMRPAPGTPALRHFVFQWEESPLAPAAAPSAPDSGSVLIVAHPAARDLARIMAETLPGPVRTIGWGTRNAQIGDSEWEVDLSDPNGLEAVLDGCPEITALYFLGGRDAEAAQEWSLTGLEAVLKTSVWALFRIVKRLLHARRWPGCRVLKVVTQALFEVHPEDAVHPGLGALQGLAASLIREFPDLRVSILDLEPAASLQALKAQAAAVLAEPAQAAPRHVALRDGIRYQRNPCELELQAGDRPAFRDQGVYLIIGGAGGIGTALASFLCRRFRARVALVGRREADELLQQRLEACRREGGEALYFRADVADPDALRAVVSAVNQQWGAIHGVVHSALVLEDKTLDRMDEPAFQAVLRPKVHGSLVLGELFAKAPLDFMLFFSSAVSLLGSAGQSNYIAACAFEDALAQALRKRVSFPVKVINWGYWGSVGVVASARYQERLRARGVGSIEPDEGMQLIENLLASPVHQVMPFKATAELLAGLGVAPRGKVRIVSPAPSILRNLDRTFERPACPDGAVLNPFVLALQELNAGLAAQLFQLLFPGRLEAASAKTWSVDALRERLGVVPSYQRLFDALLDLLAQHGWVQILRENNGAAHVRCQRDTPESPPPLDAWCEDFVAKHPASRAFLDLARPCMKALPGVLSGKLNPVEVLFPGGSFSLVENIYQGNPITDYYHQLVAHLVLACARERLQAPAARFHILEVGAGTGGTSRFVLQALASCQDRIVYHFTDISPAFTQRAQQTLGEQYPFARFAELDLERPCAGQGFEPHSIDLVLGSNVFHATRALRETLANVKQLLKPGGLLLVDEAVRLQPFATLTFGLTPGWWRFADGHRRIPGSPLLAVAQWQRLLHEAGFQGMRQFDLSDSQRQDWGQAVLIAESNSWDFSPLAPELGKEPAAAAVSFSAPLPVPDSQAQELSTPDRQRQALEFVRGVFAQVLKMPARRFESDATLEAYGVDSLVVLELNRAFEKTFGKLPTSLLFEKNTIRQLADYFLSRHTERLLAAVPASRAQASAQPTNLCESVGTRTLPDGRGSARGQHGSQPTEPRPSGSVTSSEPANTSAKIDNPVSLAPAPATPARGLDIAIIGLKGRYPGAPTLEEFWDNLKAGRSGIGEVPPDRWQWQAYYAPKSKERRPGKSYSKWGGFIAGAFEFDPLFFQLSPREAERMDPQERLFLQTAWEVIEDAGYTPQTLAGSDAKVGVFVGAMNGNYEWLAAEAFFRGEDTGACSAFWSIANRVSYLFDFQGPSLAVDTACSSSLTAIHLACQSLRRGECRAALAGGVNLILHPVHFVRLAQLNMLAADDRCKSFGDGADGFVDGEGVGAVLLKPLPDALADGDYIYAVIQGSAINSGGKTSGYTVPNPNAQSELVRCALRAAGWDPATLSYLEAHGTGTSLGDPIEIAALQQAFQGAREQKQSCAIGSVKSNIGHLESAAGIAGLTKVLLQLRHHTLVPSLHAAQLNPGIAFEDTPFRVQRETAPWQRPRFQSHGAWVEAPRRAGLSSFGAGGANAHLLLEEFTELRPVPQAAVAGPQLIVLSARNQDRLREYAGKLLAFLQRRAEASPATEARSFLENLAYTLQVGRVPLEERLAILASGEAELCALLQQFLEGAGPAPDRLFCRQKSAGPAAPSFEADEETEHLVRSWLDKGRLSQLAKWWIAGGAVDWRPLHAGKNKRRIPLPTYPFAHEHYCIAPPAPPAPLEAAPVSPVHGAADLPSQPEPPQAGGDLYVPLWRELPPALGPATAGISPERKLFVCFKPPDRSTEPWRSLLGNSPMVVMGQSPGSGNHNGHPACLDPGNVTAVKELFEKVNPEQVVVVFGAAPPADAGSVNWDTLKSAPALEIQSLLALVQAWEALKLTRRPIAWLLLTTSAFQVLANDPIEPRQAWVSGFGQSAALEYPDCPWTLVDVDAEFWRSDLDPRWRQFLEPGAGHGLKAIRTGSLYERSLVPVQLPQPFENKYRSQGVYVIAGGVGGIGFSLATWLAEHWQARLVLLGRRASDSRIEQQLERLRQKGGEAVYLPADLCDEQSLARALKQAKDRFGALHGVFHSAAVLKDGLLRRMGLADFEEPCQVKVRGSVNLAEQLRSEPLDFLVFFSSLVSLTGNAGQANYAAGGAFQDALAHHLHGRLPFPVRVLNWGYWSAAGLMANAPAAQRLERLGFQPMDPERGHHLLAQALAWPEVQVVPVRAHPRLLKQIGVDDRHRRASQASRAPSFLSAPVEIPSFRPGDVPPGLSDHSGYAESLGQLRAFSRCRLLSVFQSMGAFLEARAGCNLGSLAEKLGVLPEFQPLLAALVDHLEQSGLLRREGERLGPRLTPDETRRQLQALGDFPADGSRPWLEPLARYASLLEQFLAAYPQVLTGQMDPMDLLFPKGSTDLVQNVYAGNLVEDLYHQKVAEIIAAYLAWRAREDAQVKLRILEVGAGTGSTTRFVLPQIQPWAGHLAYYYTDVFPAFLRQGQHQFAAAHAFIQFERLDLEAQALPAFVENGFDLVLAANVLHATRDISGALNQLKRLLKTNGLLLINEMTAHAELATMTFGLAKGWWNFQDGHRRLAHSPLLSRPQWQRVLEASGLRRVQSHHADLSPNTDPVQHCILVCESDGLCLEPINLCESIGTRTLPDGRGSARGQHPPTEPRPSGSVTSSELANTSAKIDITAPGREALSIPAPRPAGLRPGGPDSTDLRERTIRYLKGVFSKILKLDANRLETEAPFDKLGIDSLVVAEILAALEKDFGSLPSILLMDRITIGQLSDYFLAEKKASLERVLQLTSGSPKHLEDPAQPSATVPKQGTPDREAASRSISIQPPPDLSDAEVNAQLEQLLEGPTP